MGLFQAVPVWKVPTGTCSLKTQAHMAPETLSGQWREMEEEESGWILQLELFEAPVVEWRTVALVCPTSRELLSSPL